MDPESKPSQSHIQSYNSQLKELRAMGTHTPVHTKPNPLPTTFSEDLKKSFHYLRGELENTLTRMEERIRQQFEEYNTLKQAVEKETKELQTIHHIRASADGLAKLFHETKLRNDQIEANIKQKTEAFETDYTQRKLSLDQELSQKREAVLSDLQKQKQSLEEEIAQRQHTFDLSYASQKETLGTELQTTRELQEKELRETRQHQEAELQLKKETLEEEISNRQTNFDHYYETEKAKRESELEALQEDYDKNRASEREAFDSWITQEKQNFENWVAEEKEKASTASEFIQHQRDTLKSDREEFEKNHHAKEDALATKERTLKTQQDEYGEKEKQLQLIEQDITQQKEALATVLRKERENFEIWKKEETLSLKLRLERLEQVQTASIYERKESFLSSQNQIEKTLDTLTKKEKAFALQQQLHSQVLEQKQKNLSSEHARTQKALEEALTAKLNQKEAELIATFNKNKQEELNTLFQTKVNAFQTEIKSLNEKLLEQDNYQKKQNQHISELEEKIIDTDTQARKDSQTEYQKSIESLLKEHQEKSQAKQHQLISTQSELLQKDQELSQLLKRIEFLENTKKNPQEKPRPSKDFIPKIVRSSRPRS